MVVGLMGTWEMSARFKLINSFLMGSPSGIWDSTVRMLQSGQLFTDTQATVFATLIGFVLGSLLGSLVGLLLWYSGLVARILDPFVVALNGVPKIALAPMIIIWFGSGIYSKIVLATDLDTWYS